MQIWRPNNLVPGDPDRDWFYLWDYNGFPQSILTIALQKQVSGTTAPPAPINLPLLAQSGFRHWWDNWYHMGARIPSNMAPGAYVVLFNGSPTGLTVTVAARATSPQQVVSAGTLPDDGPRINTALAIGDVLLMPGMYRITTPLRLNGHKLTGYGATIITQPNNAYLNHIIELSAQAALEGLELHGLDGCEMFSPVPGNNNPSLPNIVIKNCQFFDGVFGGRFIPDGLLVKNCDFRRFSVAPVTGGLWTGITIRGSNGYHAFLSEGNSAPLVVIGMNFYETDRGLILRPSWSPVANGLFCNIFGRDIRFMPNGNEVYLNEGSACAVHHNLFLHLTFTDCDGQFNIGDSPVHDNRYWHVLLDGGMGLGLYGTNPQTNNEFVDWEIRGGQVYCVNQATGNTFTRLAIVDRQLNWGNQGWVNPDLYDIAKNPVMTPGSNSFSGVTTVTNAPAVTPMSLSGPPSRMLQILLNGP